jgi:hypothetical protein
MQVDVHAYTFRPLCDRIDVISKKGAERCDDLEDRIKVLEQKSDWAKSPQRGNNNAQKRFKNKRKGPPNNGKGGGQWKKPRTDGSTA